MHYDPESNIISVEIAKGKITGCLEVGNFLIHVGKTKSPLLIEILDGGSFIAQLQKVKGKEALSSLPVTNI
jgi:hypothetical protein